MDRIYILQYESIWYNKDDRSGGRGDYDDCIIGCFTNLHLALYEAEKILTDWGNDDFIKRHKITGINVYWWSIDTTTIEGDFTKISIDDQHRIATPYDRIANVTRELIEELEVDDDPSMPVYICHINWHSTSDNDCSYEELRRRMLL